MSERILKALMQLFAIIAKGELNEETGEVNYDVGGRKIVRQFLRQELNQELIKEYISLFDEFLLSHQGKSSKKVGKRKRTSVNSVKVLRICTQINKELTQRQKIIVLIRILEFIYANEAVTEQELEFATTVAETFNIPKEEFDDCLAFVNADETAVIDKEVCLVINGSKETNLKHSKHIYADTIVGFLRVIRVLSVNTYFVRYYGNHGLYLNGQIITQDRVQVLTQGSSLRSSRVQPIYYSDIIGKFLSDKSSKKISFKAKNIQYHFKGGNIGLQDFTLNEESGHLLGIMGGSGAGKSTLLNILNGNYSPTIGCVEVNGIDLHKDKKELEGVIGFVPQDDLLIEELTVFENLFYNSKLCFGNYSDTQIAKLCVETLKSIGLYETKDLKVGSPLEKTISGGQRKRLNIALELIREPSIMFVDEPTSGLSSRDSENIMDLLKELSLKGKLIFVVIHQPSSDIFKMFDKLIILDKGGYPIYNGNPVDAVIYFKRLVQHVNSEESECITCGNVNPEQIFNIIDSKVVDEFGNLTSHRKVSPLEWNKHYIELIASKQTDIEDADEMPESIFKIPGKIKQAAIFFIRDVKAKLTNAQYMAITLFEAPALAGILGFFMKYFSTSDGNEVYTFYNSENLPQFLFISIIVSLFIGLTTSAEEIIGNLKILKREKFLNLSKGSFLFSKIFIMFLISAIQSIFYVLVGNSVLGIEGMTFVYWMILFSVSCFANLLGLNISATFNSVKVIYILIPILIIPQLLFSGILVQFDKLNPVFSSKSHVPWIGNVMASRWAYEALAVTQFKGNEYEKHFYAYNQEMKSSNWKKDKWVSNLDAKLENINSFVNSENKEPEKRISIERSIHILKNEIEKENRHSEKIKVTEETISNLELNKFNEEAYAEVKNYLATVKERYKRKYKAFEDKKDSVEKTFMKPSVEYITFLDKVKSEKIIDKKQHKKLRKFMTKLKEESFHQFMYKYKNSALEDIVTNTNSFDVTDEDNNYVIQKSYPIYLEPYDYDYLKAHFYAPKKKFFGVYFDTFTANVLVIWSMTILLIITLYMDTFKRTLDLFGRIGDLMPSFKKKK